MSSPEVPLAPRSVAPRRWGRRLAVGFLLIVILAAAGTAGWTWLSLHFAYSEGERAGILQKFSNKGWVCKTYEGELALYVVGGVSPQIWDFSVRDPKLAADLALAVGERVQLHYTEHRGVPSDCFGETSYYVESFRVVKGSASGNP